MPPDSGVVYNRIIGRYRLRNTGPAAAADGKSAHMDANTDTNAAGAARRPDDTDTGTGT